ncbi:MAG: hypothetical protein DIZ80_10810 [endosymbiont of Galathealinum brachiosum]|uniref:Uncharacterized protein n=1 Tax=endosymbiont of Galathealinum brachiosum TaxID=2200906 RepID=A0A370DCX7_9GAMM|nr:MAG: hypothetical protein DIZ80_10810 [endosymbiont of Galathealinum brachiosum]
MDNWRALTGVYFEKMPEAFIRTTVHNYRGQTSLFELCPFNPYHQELTGQVTVPAMLLIASKQGPARDFTIHLKND